MSGLGRLFLIPSSLGPSPIEQILPPTVKEVIARLDTFLVEDEKTARAFIKSVCPERVIREITLERLNEHTKEVDVNRLLEPLRAGKDMGVLSEAGCPAIADPGSLAVERAHRLGAQVVPLVGPCSMLLALMASGFNGQRWRFVGYLPIDGAARKEALSEMEKSLYRFDETQIFMDTPYRNQRLLDEVRQVCRPDTKLCVASSLTTAEEVVQVRTIAEWRKWSEPLPSGPAVFLLGK